MGKCDFCISKKPVVMYDAKDIAVPGVIVDLQSNGGWAACQECKDLIDAGKWAELEERCASIFIKETPHMPPEMVRDAVRGLHQKFREARIR